jgi:hypothetical protein
VHGGWGLGFKISIMTYKSLICNTQTQ